MRPTQAAIITLMILVAAPHAAAEDPQVFNGSFEFPNLLTDIDPPTPFLPIMTGFTETGPITNMMGFMGRLDTGVFYNFTPEQGGNPDDFVEGADGVQVGFIGAIPQPVPEDEFVSAYQFLGMDYTYESHLKYSLRVDVGKSGQQTPPDTATLGIEFIYQDGPDIEVIDSIAVPASGVEINELALWGSVDIEPADFTAAVGSEIGVRVRPLTGASGNWILDNIRIRAHSIVPGDVDADGDVDLDDFDLLAANMQMAVEDGSNDGDFDENNFVDIVDFAIMALNMGFGGPDEVLLPEPASIMLLGLGGIAALRRRR